MSKTKTYWKGYSEKHQTPEFSSSSQKEFQDDVPVDEFLNSDGLDDLKIVVGQSSGFLQPAGWLIVEHGHEQGEVVRELFNDAGFVLVETRQDYNQMDRITLGRLQD